ncbi:MAG: hypothetical protein OEU46_22990 [Alphaproteobacteria bacterium]|nr:hypothetical protein [Alphaproteobacteria bacterium]
MAQRIDDGTQPTAHSAVQAMIVRAQHAADQTGKRVGLSFDLMKDQIELVDLSAGVPEEAVIFRTVVPTIVASAPDSDSGEETGKPEDGFDPAAGCSSAE